MISRFIHFFYVGAPHVILLKIGVSLITIIFTFSVIRYWYRLATGYDFEGVRIADEEHRKKDREARRKQLENYHTLDGATTLVNRDRFSKFPHISNEQRDILGALRKQASKGENTEPRPPYSFWSSYEYDQWLRWKDLEGMSKEEASKKYVEMVKILLPEYYQDT